MWACSIGDVPTIKWLLKHNANPNLQTNNSKTFALLLVMENNDDVLVCEIIELLIKHKANPKQANVWGLTPLHLAAHKNFYKCVFFLLKQDGDLKNKSDLFGRKPKDFASKELCWRDNIGEVKFNKEIFDAL